MDLETENYLASLLMEEARRLRLQAETEGVHAYLRKPNVRGRPNSRFLSATVLGVQQANRAFEVTEMWRAREKELELESRSKDSSARYSYKRGRREKHLTDSLHRDSFSRLGRENARLADIRHNDYISRPEKEKTNNAPSYSSSKRVSEGCCSFKEGGLRDDEVEEFLRLRVKRGRGDIGSRMDEAGPYLSQRSCGQEDNSHSDVRIKEEWERRILGPEKPSFLKRMPDSDSDAETSVRGTSNSRKCSSRKKGLEERKAKKKKKSKHRHKSWSKMD